MSIAPSVINHLQANLDRYEIIHHPHSGCSSESAQMARISGNSLAKALLLQDARGFALAVIPAENLLDIAALNKSLDRHLKLALESEIGPLSPDCEPGAIPAVGPAYGLLTLVDASLCELPELYFEGGDHESLIGVSEDQFRKLMLGAQYGHFSHPRH